MESLNQLELQNVRHIHGFSGNICNKVEYYKTLTSDDNTIKSLEKICDTMNSIQENLANMLCD